MNLGYATHAVHFNSRLVYLEVSISADLKTLTVTGPPSGRIYPPGPGWLYLVVGGVPSPGRKVLIGDGKSPPVDRAAINKQVGSPDVLSYALTNILQHAKAYDCRPVGEKQGRWLRLKTRTRLLLYSMVDL
jgi:hypothetical protein